MFYNSKLDLKVGGKHYVEIRQDSHSYQLTTDQAINNRLFICKAQETSIFEKIRLDVDAKKNNEGCLTGNEVREFFKEVVDQHDLCRRFGKILAREYCKIARCQPGAFIDTRVIESGYTKFIHAIQYYPIIDVINDFRNIGDRSAGSCGRWDHLAMNDIYLLNDIRETSQFNSFFSHKKGYWPKRMKKWKEKLLVQKPILLISSY